MPVTQILSSIGRGANAPTYTYSFTPTYTSVDEGVANDFVFSSDNPGQTRLYWSITDITGTNMNTGRFNQTLGDNGWDGTYGGVQSTGAITVSADTTTSPDTQSYVFRLYSDSGRTNQVAYATITVNDTSMDTPVLLLSLDAGNSGSYPGTGDTWTDTVGNIAFTLHSSPAYSADNGGYLAFDPGSGQYADSTTSLPALSKWTVEAWHYYTGTGGGNPCLLSEKFTAGFINYALGTLDGSNLQAGFYNGWHTTPGYSLTTGNWYHIVGTYDGNTVKLYINGALVQQAVQNNAQSLHSGGGINLMRRWDNPDYWGGRLGIVRIYQGAVSSDTIGTTYNSERTRFLTQQTLVALAYGQNNGYATNYGGNQISVLVADYPTIGDVPNGATVTITGHGSGTFTVDGSYVQSGIRFFTVGTLDFTAWGSDTLTFTWMA